MRFQVKQRTNEADVAALRSVERKKIRKSKAVAAYFRLSMLAGAVGSILSSIGAVCWVFHRVRGLSNIAALYIALLIWIVLILPAIVIQVKLAMNDFPERRSQTEKDFFTVTFEENCFITSDGQAESRFPYARISKFVEGQEHFFLYFSANECIPLRKSCFVVGTPEDFGPFMREKYRTEGNQRKDVI